MRILAPTCLPCTIRSKRSDPRNLCSDYGNTAVVGVGFNARNKVKVFGTDNGNIFGDAETRR